MSPNFFCPVNKEIALSFKTVKTAVNPAIPCCILSIMGSKDENIPFNKTTTAATAANTAPIGVAMNASEAFVDAQIPFVNPPKPISPAFSDAKRPDN